MTASEAAPAPWEIWHARFNFDDHDCKFRPVLVLARTQDGLLGSMRPIWARMAGDLTAHHRRTTPNQASDMRLGQTRFQPRHDRRTILNTKHPTTPHNQLSSPGFCGGLFRPLSFVLLCVCFLLVAV